MKKNSPHLLITVFFIIFLANQGIFNLIFAIGTNETQLIQASSSSSSIVFAPGHSYFQIDNGYSFLASHLIALGYTVSQLSTDPTATDLEGVDVLFITGSGQDSFSTQTINDITDFVNDGGGLIIYGDSRGLDLGMTMGPNICCWGENNSIMITPHNITEGVSDVPIPSGANYHNMMVSGDTQVVVQTTSDSEIPNLPIVAVNEVGRGTVLGLTVGLWANWAFRLGDNSKIIENFLDTYFPPLSSLRKTLDTTFTVSSGLYYTWVFSWEEDESYQVGIQKTIGGRVDIFLLDSEGYYNYTSKDIHRWRSLRHSLNTSGHSYTYTVPKTQNYYIVIENSNYTNGGAFPTGPVTLRIAITSKEPIDLWAIDLWAIDLMPLFNFLIVVAILFGSTFLSYVLLLFIWRINEIVETRIQKEKLVDFLKTIIVISILASLLIFGGIEVINAQQEYDNSLLTSQTLPEATGTVSFDLLPEHWYEISITINMKRHSYWSTSIQGNIQIMTTEGEVLNSEHFQESLSGHEEEVPASTTKDFKWHTEVLTSELTILVKVEITYVTCELEPTTIDVFIDPPKDTMIRQIIGGVIYLSAFWATGLLMFFSLVSIQGYIIGKKEEGSLTTKDYIVIFTMIIIAGILLIIGIILLALLLLIGNLFFDYAGFDL